MQGGVRVVATTLPFLSTAVLRKTADYNIIRLLLKINSWSSEDAKQQPPIFFVKDVPVIMEINIKEQTCGFHIVEIIDILKVF